MFANNKALLAGVGTTAASPFANVIAWLLENYTSMPKEIAEPFSAAVIGLLIGAIVYFVPNVAPIVETKA